MGTGLVESDVFVVSFVGFGGRGEDGVGEFPAPLDPGGEIDATDLLGVLILFPPRAFEVASDDAFDGNDSTLASDRHPPGEGLAGGGGVGEGLVGNAIGVGGDQVGLGEVLGFDPPEPKGSDFGQQGPFSGDGGGHDDIEGTDPVGGDDQEGIVAVGAAIGEGVGITDLAEPAAWEGQIGLEYGSSVFRTIMGIRRGVGAGGCLHLHRIGVYMPKCPSWGESGRIPVGADTRRRAEYGMVQSRASGRLQGVVLN